MAVLTGLPGVEVSIVVDGIALREYTDEDEDNEPRTKAVYIEAMSNKTFAIHNTVSKGVPFKGDCLSFRVWTDGIFAEGMLLKKTELVNESHTVVSKGIEDGGVQIKLYRFNEVETVSDGHCLQSEALRQKYFGTIVVRVHHRNMLRRSRMQSKKVFKDNQSIISEKALKGQSVSHTVDFNTTEKLWKPANIWDTSYVDSSKKPAGTFIFRYRSMAVLKAMLIIPRTPSPPPLEERDPASLTMVELGELQKQLRSMKYAEEARMKIKRERSDDTPRPRKIARPNANSTQLEIDDDGHIRESTTPITTSPDEKVVIDLSE